MAGPALTTSVAGTVLIPKFYDNLLASNLYPALYLWQFGSPRSIPKGQGNHIRIPRLKKMTASMTTPTEGVPIGACPISANFLSGSLTQMAYAYSHSDVFVMTSISDVIELSVREIARQLALGIDDKILAAISTGAAADTTAWVGAANTASNSIKANTLLKPGDIARAVAKLEKNNNPRPANGHFPVIIHPIVAYDIRYNTALSGTIGSPWMDTSKYENVQQVYRGEIGRLYGASIVTSTNMKKVSATDGMCATASGYLGFAFGPEPYFVTEINGNTAQVIVKPLGSGGTYDPANQLATVAAKAYFGVIKNFAADLRYMRIVSGYTSTV